jgi:hypothetical protein
MKQRRGRPEPPSATSRLLHWTVIAAGLAIISDLVVRLMMGPAADAEAQAGFATFSIFLNVLVYSVAGTALGRETGRVSRAALAGALAGLLVGIFAGITNALAPLPTDDPAAAQAAPYVNLLLNVLTGLVSMTLSAGMAIMVQRSSRGR